ncbi:MAG: FAD-dependent oxidoreductase, partial [Thermodesulfobacteriota bacterium]
MDKKYCVYICTGCGIGASLDIDALSEVAKDEGFPVKTHAFLCGKEGVELLKADVGQGVNMLAIAACSRRVNFDVFSFDGCCVDRVNLREQVVWSHPRDQFPALTEEEKADGTKFDRVQMLAEDCIRMSMAKLKQINPPAPYKLDNFTRDILVLGGGVTGMAAALDVARAGYKVTIVEKSGALGGFAARMRKQSPV